MTRQIRLSGHSFYIILHPDEKIIFNYKLSTVNRNMTIEYALSELPAAAQQFLRAIGDARILAFHGPMGAGKTTFVSALCRQLGVQDDVNSPTFAIVNEYRDAHDAPIYHFDFYRLTRSDEALDLGLYDYLDSGALCLLEWPEIVEPLLPADTLHVSIAETSEGTRRITF